VFRPNVSAKYCKGRQFVGNEEQEIEHRARRLRCHRFNAANPVRSVMIFRVGGPVIMCLAIVVMMLSVCMNQPGMLQKRVRTRWKPESDQGKNSKCSYPVHRPHLTEARS
jgi:hypothetical protein